MSLTLYPRLPRPIARKIVERLASAAPAEVREESAVSHDAATFAPTGGRRVTEDELAELAHDLLRLAEDHGYPNGTDQGGWASFDARCAVLLHEKSGLQPTEAAREEVWAFLGCVLAPHVVRWRWLGASTPEDRFLGGDRGLRNTFGRLWWRAHLLRDDWWQGTVGPYELVFVLTEDQIVGFVERPRAVLSRLVAVAIAREALAARRGGSEIPRSALLRDVMKRFLRRGMLIVYEALEPDEMREVAKRLVDESHAALPGHAYVRQRRTAESAAVDRGVGR